MIVLVIIVAICFSFRLASALIRSSKMAKLLVVSVVMSFWLFH